MAMNEHEDELLMEQLRVALAAAEVPEERRRAAQGAFAWRTIDEELLALSHDSLVEAPALVRSAAVEQAARVLSFEGGGVQLEVELDGGQLTGQVIPGQSCRITIQSPSGAPREVTVDDTGFFEVSDIPQPPLRFRVDLGDQVLVSPWLA